MAGGTGDDTYVVDNVRDLIWKSANQDGTDTVWASVDYTLPAWVEVLYVVNAASQGTGNELGNQIYGEFGQQRAVRAGGPRTRSSATAATTTFTGAPTTTILDGDSAPM